MMKVHIPTISVLALLCVLCLGACSGQGHKDLAQDAFVRVSGEYLIEPSGDTLFIKGTNLGNWLNPEGYMFDFRRTNSAGMINTMLCQLVGPDAAAEFWKDFKDNYITREDIAFIASTGANTIRLPFHYKLFTDEDYMGLYSAQDGFERIDAVVEWCREYGLYVVLDMHDAPGGQTGDNIDDSYGYPWLFESAVSRAKFIEIWTRIAEYYRNEPVILGYDLINEPIAPYFSNMDELNAMLEPLLKEVTDAIRSVDPNHIVIWGAPQWNGNFAPFSGENYDENLMYSCHRYGGEPTREAIMNFIEFKQKTGKPMFMGEIGHNRDEWQASFCRTMQEANIGYTFWPYKKTYGSCFVGVTPPENWELVVGFSESPRGTYSEIREAIPDRQLALKALKDYVEQCRFENCTVQESYIASLLLN